MACERNKQEGYEFTQLASHQDHLHSGTRDRHSWSVATAPQRRHGYRTGTDGYGRSDSRQQLREFFEVDRKHVAVAALKALADSKACRGRK